MKINTLIQREIRRTRQTKKKARYAEDEIPLLSEYVDKNVNANPLCQGGCFAIIPIRCRIELKRLGPYGLAVDKAFEQLDGELRASLRNSVKQERKNARRSNLGQEELQGRIDRARIRIESAYAQAALFRRLHCRDHAPDPS